MSLTPRAQQLLEDYRDELSPSAASLERIREAVSQHAAVAPSPDVDVDPRTVAAPHAGTSFVAKVASSLGTKLIVAAVAASAGAAWWLHARPEPVSPRPSSSVASAASPARSSASDAPPTKAHPVHFSELVLADPGTSPSAPAAVEAATRTIAGTRRAAPVPSSDKASPAPSLTLEETPGAAASGTPASTLSVEVALLTAANRALAAGEPARALTLLAEHQARFPRSPLSQERAVTRAVALCKAGRTQEGRAAASALLANHATSPFAERLRSACGLP